MSTHTHKAMPNTPRSPRPRGPGLRGVVLRADDTDSSRVARIAVRKAGALAKWIMPGPDPGGIIVTIIIGIVGAVLGGWLLHLTGIGGGAASGGFIFSMIGPGESTKKAGAPE